MMSLSMLTVPVFLNTTPDPGLLFAQWARMYHYGHRVLPALAVATTALYTYLATKKVSAGRPWWLFLVAGLVTISMVPFT